MMKFFRKNLKTLLAVFMSLLLVVWLGGDALTSYFFKQDGRNESSPRGKAFGKTVSLGDMMGTFNELEVLNAVNVGWRTLWVNPVAPFAQGNRYYLFMLVTKVRDPQKYPLTEDEWYMLDAEARHRQITVPQDEVERFKQQENISPQLIASLQKNRQISTRDVDHALQSFIRVLRLIEQAGEGVKITEADVQNYIRQICEKAKLNVVVVDAGKLIDDKYQPTDQDLKDLFEKGKDRDPFPGSMSEFGYRRPEMTQIEYIQVSETELAKMQQVREEEAFDYWAEHKKDFLKPSTRPASAPATQPRPEDRQPYATFTEAKSLVIEKMRTDRAKAEALRLARDLIGRLSRPWANAATTQPGCKEAPASEKSDQLYLGMIDTIGKQFPGVLKHGRTALTDQMGIGMNPDIGRANAFAETNRPVPFRTAAFEVCGLMSDEQANPDLARLHRNVYETCAEPVMDAAGNAYVFRNLAASPKQAPSSWQSVRDQLTQDVRKARAYAEAERLAKTLGEQAAKASLLKAYDADPALKARLGEGAYKSPEAFARKMSFQTQMFPNRIPDVGGDEKLIDTCFVLAGQKTQAERVKASPLGGRGWIVVEGVDTVPVNQTEYDEQRNTAMFLLRAERQVDFLHNWFAPESIKQRIGWVDAEPEKKKDAEKSDQADKPEPATTKPVGEQKKS